MQKTAKKVPQHVTPAVAAQQTIQASGLTPYVGGAASYQQWATLDNSYQPTITWQDTTSNATYSSASSVLDLTVK